MPVLTYSFRGFICPVFTPFYAKGGPNLNVISMYARYLMQNGITGILVNGTTGEGTSMSVSERKIVAEHWARITEGSKQHLMIQIGGVPLPDVLELAKHAESIKADAILCLPELYFKPNSKEELIDYLKMVSEAAPNIPLLYYHIPMLTDVNIHMGHFLESIGEQIPSFVGIKFTSNNLEEGMQALNADNKKYVVFLGNDQLMYAGSAIGIDSFIATSLNVLPDFPLFVKACQSGDTTMAKKLQERISKAVIAISKYGNWVQTMKAAMKLLTPIDLGVPRAPLKPLPSETVISMSKDLSKLGYRVNGLNH